MVMPQKLLFAVILENIVFCFFFVFLKKLLNEKYLKFNVYKKYYINFCHQMPPLLNMGMTNYKCILSATSVKIEIFDKMYTTVTWA